ncbi:MAG: energy transducer TonB [Nitrosospira sp.]
MIIKRNPAFLPGLMFVLAAHGALLYFLFKQQLIPPPEQLATLIVNFIPATRPKEEPKVEPPPPAPKPKPVKPQARQLVAEAPVLSPSEPVAPPAPPEPESKPEPVAVAPPQQMAPGPVTLSSELSVACPELNAPAYPALSRRLGEEGKLVLRVELDENGRISVAQIINSSGFKRLDEAAMVAVKTWRCTPPQRNGQPVRAIALQPFNFVLQGD